MELPALTILTRSVAYGRHRLRSYLSRLRERVRLSVKLRQIFPDKNAFIGGPSAVAKGLASGLRKLGVTLTVDPQSPGNIGQTVVVLSNVAALRQAIQWKKEGRVGLLSAGPNVCMLPAEILSLTWANEIDVYLHPSSWVVDWWSRLSPSFPIPQFCWKVGVDTNFWTPSRGESRLYTLVYIKKCPYTLSSACVQTLVAAGHDVKLLEYGRYSQEQYRSLLRAADFAVFLSESESQGIALFEAWACDVPTLVWDREFFEWNGFSGRASSAPYISSLTGVTFSSEAAFRPRLSAFINNRSQFRPREWILKHGTDEGCARDLLHKFQSLRGGRKISI